LHRTPRIHSVPFLRPPSRGAGEPGRWADNGRPSHRNGRILNIETTEKQRAIEALKTLPDRATIEDVIERLCFIAKIEEGLRQSDAGQLVSHDEVEKQFLP
jgi:predicted transcriptional regulator